MLRATKIVRFFYYFKGKEWRAIVAESTLKESAYAETVMNGQEGDGVGHPAIKPWLDIWVRS
jgi:hypothetical protein